MVHNKKCWGQFRVALLLCLVAPLAVASIDRGAIQGTVNDSQDAAIAGARVAVTNIATKAVVKLRANSVGFYLAPELVPGEYSVRVEVEGFAPLDLSGIKVVAGSATTANVRLQVGATTQTIKVTAEAPLVEGTATNFTTALATNYIQDIPLLGRDIQGLTQLIPGVTQSMGPSGTNFGFDSQYGGFPDAQHIVGSGISANGSQSGANAWFLDGTLNSVLGAENVAVNPSPDAVSEFSVVNNGLAAEYGYTGGVVVSVVLKSGSNALHGSAYEFNRNSHFNATNPFARRDASGKPFLAPNVNFNNPGGTLGGPVVLPKIYDGRNRTFFFVAYDASILRETKPNILTVPLGNERFGDFRGDPRFSAGCDPANGITNCLWDPYSTTGPDENGVFHRTAYPTPVIPPTRIDPLAAYYAKSFPAPNFVDPLQQGPSGCGIYCNNYLGSVGSRQTAHNSSLKIDHSISDKHKLFVEWLYNPVYYENFRYPWNGPTAPTYTGISGAMPYVTRNQIGAVGVTSAFTPTLVNEARVMFSRQAVVPGMDSDAVTGTSETLKRVQGLNFLLDPKFSPSPWIYGGSDLGYFGPPAWQNGNAGGQAFTALDNITKVAGKHTLKAGLAYRRENAWYQDTCPYALYFFGGLTNDPVTGRGGSSLAQFLLGAVDQGSGGCLFHQPWITVVSWNSFVQDEFRIAPNFTLSAGLRWDVPSWPMERYNSYAIFNYSAMNPKVPFKGRLDYAGTPQHPDRTMFPTRYKNLAPRLSFAWQANSKTVVRGGFGIIYSNAMGAIQSPQAGLGSQTAYSQSFSYFGDHTYARPAFRLSDGSAPTIFGVAPELQKKTSEQFLGGWINMFDNGSGDPYVEQWSFSVQRELPGQSMLSVGYVGSHGLHLVGDEFRTGNYVPTATRLAMRGNINNPIPADASLGPLYGCPADPSNPGKVLCPASLVLRQFPQYAGATHTVQPDGYSRYHSLQTRFEKKYSNGFNILAVYTFQKTIASENLTGLSYGNLSPTTLSGRSLGRASFVRGAASNPLGAEDPDNRARYTSLANYDIPHVLNVVAVWDLPVGKGKHFLSGTGLLPKLLGDWSLSSNWNFQSGVPLGFGAPCNAISCLPNLIGDPAAGRSSKSKAQREAQWFNPSAFEAPFGSDPALIRALSTGLNADGTPLNTNTVDKWWTFGNAAPLLGYGRSPGFWNSDMSLSKKFILGESRHLQFRWDLFNALNHQNLGMPNTGWCLPPNADGSTDLIHQFGCQFGKITSIQTDPRAMQFGLRFQF